MTKSCQGQSYFSVEGCVFRETEETTSKLCGMTVCLSPTFLFSPVGVPHHTFWISDRDKAYCFVISLDVTYIPQYQIERFLLGIFIVCVVFTEDAILSPVCFVLPFNSLIPVFQQLIL